MIAYRLLFLGPSRAVVAVKELHCRGDDEARELARQYRDGRHLELWSGVKLIAKIPPLESK